MEAKLKGLGLQGEEVLLALVRLEEEGAISDRRVLENFIHSRFAKGHGPLRIRQEVRLKGLDDAELSACLAAYDWDEALAMVHEKKFSGSRPGNVKEYAARIRFLSQRGFEPDRIQVLLRRLRPRDDPASNQND